MKFIEYFFAPHSPWTYLGHDHLCEIAARHEAAIECKPVDLGLVFPVSGGVPLAKRAPQRQAYRLLELGRWSRHLGVPLNLQPRFFPVPADDAARLIVITGRVLGPEAAVRISGALLRAVWAEERNIGDEATLAAIATECGFDGAALMAQRAEAQAEYERYTQEAIDCGVFGSPWYRYRGENFWGQDRLDFLERALEEG